MASTTFPLIQNGSFTQPATGVNMRFNSVRPVRNENLRNVTGAGSGTADATPFYINGHAVSEWVCSGFLRLDSDGSHGLSQNSTFTEPAEMAVHAHDWMIRRYWPLRDVTGSGHTEKNWTWGLPQCVGSVRGTAVAGFGADFDVSQFTLATNIEDYGQLAGTAALENKSLGADFMNGGHVPVNFAFRMTGAITYTGTTFSWLFPTAPGDPPVGTLSLDIDDGANNIGSNGIIYDVTVRASAQRGGEIPVTCRIRQDQAPA